MSTISLYKDKLNSAGGLISSMISSLSGLDGQLDSLKTTLQGVDSSTCNMQSTVDCISSSSKTEKEKIGDLQRLNNKLDEFIGVATGRDGSAKSEINRAKDDFYTTYGYLKPDCEKSKWQRRWEKICDTVDSACDWCKEHWKIIVTIVIVAIAVVVLVCVPGLGAILAGACWGAIFGAVIGGVSGGIMSAVKGGSFWEGFENGAFDGAIGGAIGGAITGGLGSLFSPALTLSGNILRSSCIGALSSGTSNMCVTALDYYIDHGTMKGSLDDILLSGLTGAVSGAAVGALMGKLQFKSPAETAKSWQGSGDYPGVDDYVDMTIKKGTTLYRGEPNGTEYFTTLDAVDSSGRNATTLFEGLQVKPHPTFGYRGQVSGYQFVKDVTAAYGKALANPQFGSGGLPQFYVPDVQKLIDKGILVLVDTIDLVK